MNKHSIAQMLFSLSFCHGAADYVKTTVNMMLSDGLVTIAAASVPRSNSEITQLFLDDLIDRNADIDHPDPRQLSALTYVAIGGNCDVARWLIDKKADVNRQTVSHDGQTTAPVYEAFLHGQKEMLGLLLDNGAQISDPFLLQHVIDCDWRCMASTEVLLKKWGGGRIAEAVCRESHRQLEEKVTALSNLEREMSASKY